MHYTTSTSPTTSVGIPRIYENIYGFTISAYTPHIHGSIPHLWVYTTSMCCVYPVYIPPLHFWPHGGLQKRHLFWFGLSDASISKGIPWYHITLVNITVFHVYGASHIDIESTVWINAKDWISCHVSQNSQNSEKSNVNQKFIFCVKNV
jgi:hypothetical protein